MILARQISLGKSFFGTIQQGALVTTATMKRVTAADVAKAAGVSRATVGFVLNGTKGQTISAATTKKVQDAAVKLGYTPHSQAQALRSGRSKIVLMVLPDWPLEHQMRVHLEQVAQVLDDAGLTLVTHTRRSHAGQSSQPVWAAIDPLAVVGLEPFSEADIASMHRLNITNIIPSPGQQPERVLPDDEVFDASIAHRLQVEHLLERGHRRLGFAMPADQRLHELAEARLQAVVAACDAEGLAAPIVITPIRTEGDRSEYDLEGAVRDGVTAVIAYNDNVAADIIGSAATQNLRVPGDLAVIGHDDSPLAGRFIPSISSVRVDHRLLGQYVGNLVLQSAGLRDAAPLPHIEISVTARASTSESAPGRRDARY
jgi:DNA-binding LacI/PurR family transcriptional regulator